MATSSGPDSDSDSDDDDKVFSKLSCAKLISTIKYLLKNVQGKTRKYNVLHNFFKELHEKEVTMNHEIENLKN